MSFLDKAKATAEQAKTTALQAAEVAKTKAGEAGAQAKTAAQQAAAKIESAGVVEKAASFVDEKTKGKYADQIAKAQEQAKSAVGKVSKTD